ncbi:Ferric uptake regulation protein [uncultured delta proteobacterium]|uniref:Ferric uptake regulation protein n=1 Tax=uncultured delta proteobacterium TaxID=34034 RepID=A0A212JTN3_9DELT|nr:Ferric uptake regulation protein [uncultured delta proteobacterium]
MKQALKQFSDYVTANGLKFTPQRRLIADVFLRQTGHLSTEELYDRVRKEDPSIGQATVYRTLKLFCDSGLAKEVHFGDGMARYESTSNSVHHDHLICIGCGKQVEFMDAEIEKLQEKLAEKNGFLLTSHHMYLYGVCPACRKK